MSLDGRNHSAWVVFSVEAANALMDIVGQDLDQHGGTRRHCSTAYNPTLRAHWQQHVVRPFCCGFGFAQLCRGPFLPTIAKVPDDPKRKMPLAIPPALGPSTGPHDDGYLPDLPTQDGLAAVAAPAAQPRQRAPMIAANTAVREQIIAGRYRVIERIGQGGMGKVYRVAHMELGKIFALKIICSKMEANEARDMFYHEAKLASRLSHPNVASVVDFGEDDAIGLYMVMEFCEGVPLMKLLYREKRLGARLACEIAQHMAEALRYIHDNDIVHCDIKTENVLVNLPSGTSTKRRGPDVKLLDFGLARTLSLRNTSLSGTPHYLAPERIRGEPASPGSDVYSLGILLYELITGRVPWDGQTQHILDGHLHSQPTPPAQFVPDLDPALERLIMHALEKNPARRHADMSAFLYELHAVMEMMENEKRRSPATKIVVQRQPSEREAAVESAFAGCRLPLAVLTADGTIVAANVAFAKFVTGTPNPVEGMSTHGTALAHAWNTLPGDIAKCLTGTPVRRSSNVQVADGTSRRLLLFLDRADEQHVIVGVHPMDA